MYFVDTHAHISHFKPHQQADVIRQARVHGVKKMINVACDLDQIKPHLALAKTDPDIWTTAGVHPTSLHEDLEEAMEQIYQVVRNEEKIIAIGEIGLDYYHDKFPHDMQDLWLTRQLAIATKLNLPAIIHCRAGKNPGENAAAFDDLIRILKREHFSNAVIHCFSGTSQEAKALLEIGVMISFTGIVTYSSNQNLRETVKMIPLDRMMLETDAPYLSVEGKRDQGGHPMFMEQIAQQIADLKGVSLEEVARVTSENAERFFGI